MFKHKANTLKIVYFFGSSVQDWGQVGNLQPTESALHIRGSKSKRFIQSYCMLLNDDMHVSWHKFLLNLVEKVFIGMNISVLSVKLVSY